MPWEQGESISFVIRFEVMRLSQRKLILIWGGVGLSLALLSISHEYIMFHWETIRWPVFFVTFIAVIFLRSKEQLKVKSVSEVINESPWIKVYVILYCFLLVLASIYIMAEHINIVESLNVPMLLAIVLGTIFPALVIQQIELYKFLGNGYNNSGQRTR